MTKSNIPEDLVIEILKRLPVRSLMRLRCVCKTWCALTNNPDFVNLHLQFNHTHVNDNRLVVKHWDEAANTNIFSLFPRELEDGLPLTLNLDLQSKGIIEQSIKIAYCDGIFCIYDRSSRLISLWNPAIREFKTLPFLSYLSANEDTYRHVSQLGFGFDCRNTNGYRVIVLISSLYPEGQDFCPLHVYSHRTNSWRVVDCFLPFIRGPVRDTSICTNGFLHWPNMACYPSVLSFDLGEESFQETPILGLPEKANYRIDLASIDGSVAVIQSWIGKHSERGSYFDVWVMKEFGVKESWTHKYSVKFSPNLYFRSLGLWKSGELLLNLEGHLYLYDPNTQQTKDLGFQGKTVSDDAERSLIVKLKTECGYQFTSKLEGMFTDMKTSQDTMKAFYAAVGAELAEGPTLAVQVLTTGSWPTQSGTTCNLPPEILGVCNKFRTFYLGTHTGRRLSWQTNMGTADLKATFGKGQKHELNRNRTGNGDTSADLKRCLQSLACVKGKNFLRKDPMSKEIGEDDTFLFNDKFSSKFYMVKIGTVVAQKESEPEKQEIRQRVEEDRKPQIEQR
ncbi:hypothetical protein LguiB_010217 [Lonicera macranthoides]